MTKQELADLLGVSRNTLNEWEKKEEKQELIKLINLGLKAKETILETEKLLEKLKEIDIKASSGRFELK